MQVLHPDDILLTPPPRMLVIHPGDISRMTMIVKMESTRSMSLLMSFSLMTIVIENHFVKSTSLHVDVSDALITHRRSTLASF